MERYEEARDLLERLIQTSQTLVLESPSSDVSRPPKEVLESMQDTGYAGIDGSSEEPPELGPDGVDGPGDQGR